MAYVSVAGRPNKAQLSQYVRTVRGMAGLGMGQDGGDITVVDPVTGDTTVVTPTTSGSAFPIDTSAPIPGSYNITGVDPTAVPGAVAAASSPAAGGGFNLTSFLNSLSGSASSALKLYQSAQGPSLVPGTNAIFNPVTGQYYNPTTGQVVNPVGASLASIPFSGSGSMLLIGGLVIGGVVLISMLGKR